jgi:hypothetical protein
MIIHIPENYVPERSYVLHVIFRTLLGLEYQIEIDSKATGTIIHIDHHQYIFPDFFFGNENDPQRLYRKDNLPEKVISGSGLLEGIVFLYGIDKVEHGPTSTTISADIFASAFFMLSRWEELLSEKDQHGRFKGGDSIAYKNGFHLRPIVNEYAGFLRRLFTNARIDVPQKHQFRKILTVDVDTPFYWTHRPFRKLIGSLFNRQPGSPSFLEKWKSYRAFRKNFLTDPYFTFDHLMKDGKEAGAEMIFYFISGGANKLDGKYRVNDAKIVSLIDKITSNGHKIGLHGSYNSYQDEVMLNQERLTLEKVVGQQVVYTRQHYLRFSIEHTISVLQKAKFKVDSTIGYADIPGFRSGICHPYPLFHLSGRKMLDLVEMPLVVMDATLRHYQSLTAEVAIEVISQLAHQVRKHEGTFVFLWHNSSFEFGGYEKYRPVYNSLLSC